MNDVPVLCYLFRQLKFQLQLKTNFKLSGFLLSLGGTKNKVKIREGGMIRIIV